VRRVSDDHDSDDNVGPTVERAAVVTIPAGASPPAPDDFDGVTGWVHAVDGDGTPLCGASADVEQIDHRQ
jgi:hypothetical protein